MFLTNKLSNKVKKLKVKTCWIYTWFITAKLCLKVQVHHSQALLEAFKRAGLYYGRLYGVKQLKYIIVGFKKILVLPKGKIEKVPRGPRFCALIPLFISVVCGLGSERLSTRKTKFSDTAGYRCLIVYHNS